MKKFIQIALIAVLAVWVSGCSTYKLTRHEKGEKDGEYTTTTEIGVKRSGPAVDPNYDVNKKPPKKEVHVIGAGGPGGRSPYYNQGWVSPAGRSLPAQRYRPDWRSWGQREGVNVTIRR
jgi:hypothetical protein